MSSSPFSFELSPQPQSQQQLASASQPAADPEGFALCPSSTAGLPDTAEGEGSAMAFLFAEGGEGGMGLFDSTSSPQEQGLPVDSASSWSFFGGDGGGTPCSQNESFTFAFGGSPQTPRSEGSNSTSMFQF